MSLRSVGRTGRNEGARVAVVGAPTDDGTHLREALAEFGVPGTRVDLYATGDGEVLISEYAGEARMIQEPDLGEIVEHDVIFICERGELAHGVYSAAASGVVVIDLLDCLPGAAPGPDNGDGPRCFRVAHPLSLLLSEVLAPLDDEMRIKEAIALILRPASDFGQDGVEELREQTVRLLNFAEVPKEVFGRQLAFNLIPAADRPEEHLESRIRGEVAGLLEWQQPRLTAKLLTAPLFHGHGVQLHLRFDGEPGVERVRGSLAAVGLEAGGSAATPLDVIGEVRTRLSGLTEDGLGGYWLWVVAGETGSRSAREAVRLAASVGPL